MKNSHLFICILWAVLTLRTAGAEHIETFFSPAGGGRGRIIHYLDNAVDSVRVAVYKLYNRELSDALERAHQRGVDVEILIDGSNSMNKKSKYPYLKEKGLAIKTYAPPSGGHMHHKFCLVDNKIIITGSYNWNDSAEDDNNETLLFIKNHGELMEKFNNEFNKLWNIESSNAEGAENDSN